LNTKQYLHGKTFLWNMKVSPKNTPEGLGMCRQLPPLNEFDLSRMAY